MKATLNFINQEKSVSSLAYCNGDNTEWIFHPVTKGYELQINGKSFLVTYSTGECKFQDVNAPTNDFYLDENVPEFIFQLDREGSILDDLDADSDDVAELVKELNENSNLDLNATEWNQVRTLIQDEADFYSDESQDVDDYNIDECGVATLK